MCISASSCKVIVLIAGTVINKNKMEMTPRLINLMEFYMKITMIFEYDAKFVDQWRFIALILILQ